MILAIQFVFLAAVIVVAGLFLTKYADAIADATGLGRTLAGLVLLAAATSLPELAVNCAAVTMTPPAPDLAVGAVVGSSVFNLLILGVMDFCHWRKDRIISPESAGHALSAITTIILTSVVLLFVLLKQFPLEWNSIGLGPFLVFLIYVFSLRLIYLDQLFATDGKVEDESSSPYGLTQAIIGYVVATSVIFVAARYLAPTADKIAQVTNLGGTFVGSTFVALTTSLPEVVTTFAAVRMGAFDLAVGNVLGSNAFNMAILFPVDVFYRQGSLLRDADNSHAVTAAAVIVITGIVCLGLLYRPKKRYWLLEPDAALVVLFSVAAFVALYYMIPTS